MKPSGWKSVPTSPQCRIHDSNSLTLSSLGRHIFETQEIENYWKIVSTRLIECRMKLLLISAVTGLWTNIPRSSSSQGVAPSHRRVTLLYQGEGPWPLRGLTENFSQKFFSKRLLSIPNLFRDEFESRGRFKNDLEHDSDNILEKNRLFWYIKWGGGRPIVTRGPPPSPTVPSLSNLLHQLLRSARFRKIVLISNLIFFFSKLWNF